MCEPKEDVGPERTKKDWILGLFFIFLVAVIWALASVWVQFIYERLDFASPFLLTYTCTSLFSIYLPLHWIGVKLGWVTPLPTRKYETIYDEEGIVKTNADTNCSESSSPTVSAQSSLLWSEDFDSLLPLKLTRLQTMKLGLLLSPLWFLANCPYNVSLLLTSVSSSTVISTTSALFTFVISTCLSLEAFSWVKLAGVVACMGGTIAVTYADEEDSGKDSVWGDLICLFAAFMYAAYTTVLRHKAPNDEAVSMPVVFGCLGVCNAVLLLPVVVLVLFLHPATFAMVSWEILGCLVVKGLLDNVLSDYFWARAVVLTTPTVATVGLSLTIPLAFASDFVLGKSHSSLISYAGALAVFIGFVMVSIPNTFYNNF
mmetsp:Transcript_33938/g.44777  ORF Transcript_33938/g.44777 Transcript_33938/m.44777 type:complete len:372 (-) Transcript_33938:305-1420(-)